MDVTGSIIIKAHNVKLWNALNDPHVLLQCIPACVSLTGTPEDGFKAGLSHRIGGMPIRVECKLDLTQVDLHRHLKFQGSGTNILSRGTKYFVDITLEPTDSGHTKVSYTATAKTNAALRSTLGDKIDSFAGQFTDVFFRRLATAVQ